MTDSTAPMLSADRVTYGFPQRPDFLRPVSLDIGRGECVGIVGPNGAGKSTLVRLLAGLVAPASGRVVLQGRDVRMLSPIVRARQIAFLPQQPPRDLPLTVREVVLMGRFPHRRYSLFESADDFAVVRRVMATTDILHCADRPLATLSGGEAQRAHLAAALAQAPAVLLLDEPTAAMDLYYQLSVFELLQRLVEKEGLAVVVVTHDLNLAARYCSRVLLLDDGRPAGQGRPAEVLVPAVLESVYRVRLALVRCDGAGTQIVALSPFRTTGQPS